MARTLVVVLTCDRCAAEGTEGTEGAESVSFGFDSFSYSVDLCSKHAEDFHNTVQTMITWSSDRTRLGSPPRARRSSPSDASTTEGTPARTPADRDRLKAIREWARKHGHPELSDRGRIPQAVVSEYDVAHKE